MEQFIDKNGCIVSFSENNQEFLARSGHVLVICIYEGKWVLTQHKIRGWEFPGGKVEEQESVRDAAEREVYEETGGVSGTLFYLGSYHVDCGGSSFYKSVFFTVLKSLETRGNYYETDGPLLVARLPENLTGDDRFSFIMKDRVIPVCMRLIDQRGLCK
ncbi:RNA deprotection pyrophosphohydrolase [Peribacillus deserti]|nr:nucleoside triphosphatase YtkD [Peribacillus deserti]